MSQVQTRAHSRRNGRNTDKAIAFHNYLKVSQGLLASIVYNVAAFCAVIKLSGTKRLFVLIMELVTMLAKIPGTLCIFLIWTKH